MTQPGNEITPRGKSKKNSCSWYTFQRNAQSTKAAPEDTPPATPDIPKKVRSAPGQRRLNATMTAQACMKFKTICKATQNLKCGASLPNKCMKCVFYPKYAGLQQRNHNSTLAAIVGFNVAAMPCEKEVRAAHLGCRYEFPPWLATKGR
jgi:hypothetical protein